MEYVWILEFLSNELLQTFCWKYHPQEIIAMSFASSLLLCFGLDILEVVCNSVELQLAILSLLTPVFRAQIVSEKVSFYITAVLVSHPQVKSFPLSRDWVSWNLKIMPWSDWLSHVMCVGAHAFVSIHWMCVHHMCVYGADITYHIHLFQPDRYGVT